MWHVGSSKTGRLTSNPCALRSEKQRVEIRTIFALTALTGPNCRHLPHCLRASLTVFSIVPGSHTHRPCVCVEPLRTQSAGKRPRKKISLTVITVPEPSPRDENSRNPSRAIFRSQTNRDTATGNRQPHFCQQKRLRCYRLTQCLCHGTQKEGAVLHRSQQALTATCSRFHKEGLARVDRIKKR